MFHLKEFVSFLDNLLSVQKVPDFEGSCNGLQVEGSSQVRKIASAVDVSLSSLQKAVDLEVDLLLVHHGLFWNGVQPISGAFKEMLEVAMKNHLSVYSVHLPLDIHPSLGNNALLAQKIGMDNPVPCFSWKEVFLGLKQKMDVSFEDLSKKLLALGGNQISGGHFSSSDKVGMLAVSSGSAGSQILQAEKEGINTLITGEGEYWNLIVAENSKINLIFLGHYESEVFGIDALGKEVGKHFQVPYHFLESLPKISFFA